MNIRNEAMLNSIILEGEVVKMERINGFAWITIKTDRGTFVTRFPVLEDETKSLYIGQKSKVIIEVNE